MERRRIEHCSLDDLARAFGGAEGALSVSAPPVASDAGERCSLARVLRCAHTPTRFCSDMRRRGSWPGFC